MSNGMYLGKVSNSKRAVPRKTLIYGQEGVGKSSFAAAWPKPLFLPVEDGIAHLSADAFPTPADLEGAWAPIWELNGKFGEVPQTPYQTLVIDTMDALERLFWAKIADDHGTKSVADIGYGKGYAQSASMCQQYLADLSAVNRRCNMHIIVVAHADVSKYEDPEGDSYDRYTPKLHKSICGMVMEWADEVLFAKFRVYTRNRDEGFGRERTVATSANERIIRTVHSPASNAKNRLGLPDEMPLDFQEYSKFLPQTETQPVTAVPKLEVKNG